jgi:Flp pilus assembly protein TadG
MMLLLGMFSGGIAYNRKLDLQQAAREGARAGATLPKDTLNWAQTVQDLVVARSEGTLTSRSQVCVALVKGSTPHAVDADHYANPFSSDDFCFADTSGESAERVQVFVSRDTKIEALMFSYDQTITGRAVTTYELS